MIKSGLVLLLAVVSSLALPTQNAQDGTLRELHDVFIQYYQNKVLDSYSLDEGTVDFHGKVNYQDAKISNVKLAEFPIQFLEEEALLGGMHILYPSLKLSGVFDADINILNTPVTIKGKADFEFLNFTVNFDGLQFANDDEFRVETMGLNFDLDNIVVKLSDDAVVTGMKKDFLEAMLSDSMHFYFLQKRTAFAFLYETMEIPSVNEVINHRNLSELIHWLKKQL